MADKLTVSAQYLMLKDFIQRHTAQNQVRSNLIGALDTMNYGWERCSAMVKMLTSAVQSSPFKAVNEEQKTILLTIPQETYNDLVARYVVPPPEQEDASSSALTTEPSLLARIPSSE